MAEKDKPWEDEEKLRRLYRNEGLSCNEVGQRLGCSRSTIQRKLEKYDIEKRESGGGGLYDEHPWRDESLLRELYHDRELFASEIALELGCSQTVVRDWLKKYDIPDESLRADAGKRRRKIHPSFAIDDGGYFVAQAHHPERAVREQVYIHRLCIVAWSGFEALGERVVHHQNHIPWDNRPSNLELLDESEHGRLHAIDRWHGGGT